MARSAVTSGFPTIGKANPVPLAELGSGKQPGCTISFTNGITRSIWLLANEARFFPVLVRNRNLVDVEAAVGALGAPMLDLGAALR
jgi:hypothetical protein